jgi:hypothetical protein
MAEDRYHFYVVGPRRGKFGFTVGYTDNMIGHLAILRENSQIPIRYYYSADGSEAEMSQMVIDVNESNKEYGDATCKYNVMYESEQYAKEHHFRCRRMQSNHDINVQRD